MEAKLCFLLHGAMINVWFVDLLFYLLLTLSSLNFDYAHCSGLGVFQILLLLFSLPLLSVLCLSISEGRWCTLPTILVET